MNTSLEIINRQKLGICIDNFETLARPEWDEQETKVLLTRLKTIYRKTKKSSKLKTTYKFAKNKTRGRKYVANGLGLQALPREFRNSVGDEYFDYDIKNCFPTLLANYCLTKEWNCDELLKYNANREKYIQENDFNVKVVVNSMMNNGWSEYDALQEKPEWLVKLKKEFLSIHALIKTDEETAERFKKIKKTNPIGTLTFEILENIESTILDDMLDYITTNLKVKIESVVLMYDGFMLPKDAMTEEELKQLDCYVNAKYKVNIIKKPMETLNLDGLTEKDELPENDYDSAVAFLDWLEGQGHRLIRYKKKTFWFNKDVGIYNNDLFEIRKFIAQCDEINIDYRKTTAKQNSLLTQLEVLIPNDLDLLSKFQTSTYRKLPFKNGVYDFETKQLLDFSHEYMFLWKLKWDFDPDFDLSLYEETVRQKLLVDIFGASVGDYFLKRIARAIAGEIFDKVLTMVLGDTNSGKGVISEICNSAFGSFAESFNASFLSSKKFAPTDESKALSWVVPLVDKRLIFSNEINMEQSINGNLLKTITSGGDGITARQNHQDEEVFVPQFSVFMFAQDSPAIAPHDQAVMDRLNYLPTKYSYLAGNKYENKKHLDHIRKADPDIKSKFIKDPVIIQTFMYMVINAYSTEKPLEPEEVIAENQEWEEEEDIEGQIIGLFVDVKPEDRSKYPNGGHLPVSTFNGKVDALNLKVSKRKIKDIMRKNGYIATTITHNSKTFKGYRDIAIPRDQHEDY